MTDTPPPPPDAPPGPPAGEPADASRASHRGRRKASSVVLPLVFALALVLIGFLAMWGWITWSGGNDGNDGNNAAAPTTPPASVTPSPTPISSSASPSPTTSGSSSPSASPTTTSSSPSPSPKPSKTAQPDRSTPVVVFNQTSISGLAAAYAAKLQQAGWRVTGVDNWTGFVPETTVYYRPGDEPAARQLMRDLPTVNRIRAAVSGMPSQGLTLIIAGNAPTP